MYPHSSSTCRIWNKIISYSAIRRDPHRGGWVVGRAGGRQVAFFGALAKGDVSSSIALAGKGFLPKSFVLIKYSPLCNLQTETFLQNPIHTFLPCVPKFMSDILCGCGMLRKETQLFVIGWGLLRHTRPMATFLGDQCDLPSLQLTVETKIFVILMFGISTLNGLKVPLSIWFNTYTSVLKA